MADKIITLKYAGVCRDCGTHLPAGSRARWYGRGIVYGLDCHEHVSRAEPYGYPSREDMVNADHEALRLIARPADDPGVYTLDGRKIGSTCGCEDYPCCGH